VVLPVSQLSLADAFIVSMRIRPVGTAMSVVLRLGTAPPLPAICGRVIAMRIDASIVERTGFQLLFEELDDERLAALAGVLSAVGQDGARMLRERARPERRRYPRVAVDLRAHAQSPEGTHELGVANLSMSGAKLTLRDKLWPHELMPKAQLLLTVIDPDIPESLEVRAEVVRLSSGGGLNAMGVRFVEVDDRTSQRLEGLIASVLLTGGSPQLGQDGRAIRARVRQ